MSHPEFSYAKKGVFVRVVYLLVALLVFSLRRMRSCPAGVVVLCYHSVSARQRSAFARQMRHVARRAKPLEEVCAATDGDSSVVVTFDDAFDGLIENAVPEAARLGVPIAIFAVAGCIGDKPTWLCGSAHPDAALTTMSSAQLRELARESGCLIGSHSVSHSRLGDLSLEDVERELVASKSVLEETLGKACDYLALPHGSYRPEVIELAVRSGYKKVLTLDEIALPSRWPANTVGRFSVSPDMWMVEFVLTVQGAYAWLYPWRQWLRRIRGGHNRVSNACG